MSVSRDLCAKFYILPIRVAVLSGYLLFFAKIEVLGGNTFVYPNDVLSLDAEPDGPRLIRIRWNSADNLSAPVSYQEKGDETWLSLPSTGVLREYLFHRLDLCGTYHFRIQTWLRRDNSHQPREVKIEKVVPPEVPKRLNSVRPKIAANFYNSTSKTVDVLVGWTMQDRIPWLLKDVLLSAYVDVIDCAPVRVARLPATHRLNDTHFRVRFKQPYFQKPITDGQSCKMAFIFQPFMEICKRIVLLEDDLSKTAALIQIDCVHTQDMPCRNKEPNCKPAKITVSDFPEARGVLVQWEFNTTITEKFGTPLKFLVRYMRLGNASRDFSEEKSPLIIGKLPKIQNDPVMKEVSGLHNGTVISFKSKDSSDYRISICAVYDAHTKIMWKTVPQYSLALTEQSTSVSTTTHMQQERTLETTASTAHILCAPDSTYGDVGFNWRPIAIGVALFTIGNVLIMIASCYMYSEGQKRRLVRRTRRNL